MTYKQAARLHDVDKLSYLGMNCSLHRTCASTLAIYYRDWPVLLIRADGSYGYPGIPISTDVDLDKRTELAKIRVTIYRRYGPKDQKYVRQKASIRLKFVHAPAASVSVDQGLSYVLCYVRDPEPKLIAKGRSKLQLPDCPLYTG